MAEQIICAVEGDTILVNAANGKAVLEVARVRGRFKFWRTLTVEFKLTTSGNIKHG